MTDEVLMNVLDTADDLAEVEFGLLLGDLVVLDKVVELALWGQLHYDEDVIGCV